MSNLNVIRNSGFQCLLYTNFIVLKKYRVDTAAQIMGHHKDTLYKWIRGERPFPVDEVPNLTKATGDTGYLEYLCDQSGFCLMPKIKDRATAKMFSHMAQVMRSVIDLKEEEK